MALNILLTNDDGFDSEGIGALFDALVDAGHSVTIAAPAGPQSGQGSTLGGVEALFSPLEITEFSPGNFAVAASPIVSVLTGLDFLAADRDIDIVLSGINEGANVGPISNSSGTVNAAVGAILSGVPAIAVSADPDEAGDFSQSYDAAAAFVLELLDRLEAAQADGAPLLPAGTGLSVNLPVPEPTGRAVTVLDEVGSIVFGAAEIEPGLFSITVEQPVSGGNPISEGDQFLLDRLTVSALDGDWSAPEAQRASLAARLDGRLAEDTPTARSLDILLTNDDGFDAPGITAVAAALGAAGHSVTIVAPAEQQSGIGTALTFPTWTATEFAPGNFAVDATPTTTVLTALDAILTGEDTPDLVVSGTNEGANVGPIAISSGTVSAAVAALRLSDLPAIAISTGTDAAGEVPDGLFELSADVLVELIDDLLDTAPQDGSLLPAGIGLSVNVPPGADPANVAFTSIDEGAPFSFSIGEIDQTGSVGFIFGGPVGSDNPNSEGVNFTEGAITITPLAGTYQADSLQPTQAIAGILGVPFGQPLVFAASLPIDVRIARVFDRDFYLEENPDVATAGVDPLGHFLTFGEGEGRAPNALFDIQAYLVANPDVADAVAADETSAFRHFIANGLAEGRIGVGYDEDFYLATNPDVAAAVEAGEFSTGYEHAVLFGLDEGRLPAADGDFLMT